MFNRKSQQQDEALYNLGRQAMVDLGWYPPEICSLAAMKRRLELEKENTDLKQELSEAKEATRPCNTHQYHVDLQSAYQKIYDLREELEQQEDENRTLKEQRDRDSVYMHALETTANKLKDENTSLLAKVDYYYNQTFS